MTYLPPVNLRACLDESVFKSRPSSAFPALASSDALNRRSFLSVATAGLALLGSSTVSAGGPLVFSPQDGTEPVAEPDFIPSAAPLQLGQIPADFWLRPRELWLKRQNTRQEIRVIYWKDGKLLADGYWQACAMLRDVKANVMTTMDPTVLDILRGVLGYYQAWQYNQPIVINSGFRTVQTNQALIVVGAGKNEGAAKNSMHLYGKAVDLSVPGIPSRDIGILGMNLQQGGVGFYPSLGFTHLDTGRLRTWVGH